MPQLRPRTTRPFHSLTSDRAQLAVRDVATRRSFLVDMGADVWDAACAEGVACDLMTTVDTTPEADLLRVLVTDGWLPEVQHEFLARCTAALAAEVLTAEPALDIDAAVAVAADELEGELRHGLVSAIERALHPDRYGWSERWP
jgi:hypothetical protein